MSSHVTVIPLRKPRKTTENGPSASTSVVQAATAPQPSRKRANAKPAARKSSGKASKKGQDNEAIKAAHSIGRSARYNTKRKGGYWWSKQDVEEDEEDDAMIAQAILKSNYMQPSLLSMSKPLFEIRREPQVALNSIRPSPAVKQEEQDFHEYSLPDEKPSLPIDQGHFGSDGSVDPLSSDGSMVVLKEEELGEEVAVPSRLAYTDKIKEEEPEYSEDYQDVKPSLLDPALLEVVAPLATSDAAPTLTMEIKEEIKEEVKEEYEY